MTKPTSPVFLPSDNPWATPPGGSKKPSSNGSSWGGYDPSGRSTNAGGSSGGTNGKKNSDLPPFFQWVQHPGHNTGKLSLVILAGLAIWLASGLYRVNPEEQGIVTRFGRYIDTVEEQGLKYHLPWPIETVQKINVTFERRLEIGFMGGGGQKVDNPDESQMLTGDANIVDIDFVVQWKIGDAKHFLFNIREPENTIKKVAESSMREVVGQNEMQDIITDGREDVAQRVRKNMQATLDSYQAGVSITQVLIQDASVPPPVLEAFEDVIRATQEAETSKNQAYKYRNQIVPRAQGDAIRLVKEAEGYKEQVINQAKGEAKRFNDVYTVYQRAPEATRTRLYLEAVQNVLQKGRTVITDGTSSPLSILNLNDLQKRAAHNADDTP